jgi:hypothetical protein
MKSKQSAQAKKKSASKRFFVNPKQIMAIPQEAAASAIAKPFPRFSDEFS